MIIQISASRTSTTYIGDTKLLGGLDWFRLIQSFRRLCWKRSAACPAVDPMEPNDGSVSTSFAVLIKFGVASRGEEELNNLRETSIVASKNAHILARSCLFVSCVILTKTEI